MRSSPECSTPSTSNSGLVPAAISVRLVELTVRFHRFGRRYAAQQAHRRAADGPPSAAVLVVAEPHIARRDLHQLPPDASTNRVVWTFPQLPVTRL